MTHRPKLLRRLPWIVVLALAAALILTACARRGQPEPAPQQPTAVAELANPAAALCQEQGGRLETRTTADGSQTTVCIFADGSTCEQWAFFRGECKPGDNPGDSSGVGLPNPAAVYCEEQGGQLEIRTAADGSQAGTCIFPDGSACDEWAFFRGECQPGGATETPAAAAQEAGSTGPAATLLASLPEGAFESVADMALTAPQDSPSLWAAYTTGLRNFELDPVPGHVVAIFTRGDAGWQELARLDLDALPMAGGDLLIDSGPDYVDPQGVQQVDIDPGRVWLAVNGGAGAHSGTFQLLSFDGQTLRQELGGGSSSPGAGAIADVDGDGQNDVVLDTTEHYVFCYACGVTHPYFEVYAWLDGSMVPVEISELMPSERGQPYYEANAQAVALAGAGLWPAALAQIEEAVQLAERSDLPAATGSLRWNEALIGLNQEAQQEALAASAYPLLSYVFAGDYAAAVDQMRSYSLDEIFNPQTPLIAGTAAEGWEDAVSNNILESANAALAVQPDLAPAYFLRAWAEFLADPGSRAVGADLTRAARRAPDDPLFAAAARLNIAPEPTTAAAEARSRQHAIRIQFAPGTRSAMVGGALVPGGSPRYVLQAQAGQTMDVALVTRAEDVLLEITGADGTELKRAADAGQSWQGALPTSQDYFITVTGTTSGAPYQLKVTIPPRSD